VVIEDNGPDKIITPDSGVVSRLIKEEAMEVIKASREEVDGTRVEAVRLLGTEILARRQRGRDREVRLDCWASCSVVERLADRVRAEGMAGRARVAGMGVDMVVGLVMAVAMAVAEGTCSSRLPRKAVEVWVLAVCF